MSICDVLLTMTRGQIHRVVQQQGFERKTSVFSVVAGSCSFWVTDMYSSLHTQ